MRTHPLPPPDSDCVMQDVQPTVVSSFGCFVFEILGSSFSIWGASFSSFGCFVFEIWVLRFRDLGASCFGLRFRVLRFRNYRVAAWFPRQNIFKILSFIWIALVLSDCGKQSTLKTHQCVFQFIYLTSTCLVLVYECNSRRATLNFSQSYATSGVNVT